MQKVDPNAITFDVRNHQKTNALQASIQGALAYQSDEAIEASFEGSEWRVRPFHVGDTDGFVAERDGHVIVSIRGTEVLSAGDVWANLCAWPVRHPYIGAGRGHGGFMNGAWLGLNKLVDILLDWGLTAASIKQWFLSGHSQGAAVVAGIAMGLVEIAHVNGRQISVLVDGMPRLVTKSAIPWFEASGIYLRRYLIPDDPVPTLPPPVAFRHLGRLSRITVLGQHKDYGKTRVVWSDRAQQGIGLASAGGLLAAGMMLFKGGQSHSAANYVHSKQMLPDTHAPD